jgi:hypothetical protein
LADIASRDDQFGKSARRVNAAPSGEEKFPGREDYQHFTSKRDNHERILPERSSSASLGMIGGHVCCPVAEADVRDDEPTGEMAAGVRCTVG